MAIYRGTGGAGNATTDSEIALLTQLEQSATAAAATASTAATTATTKAAEAAASAASITGDVADAEAARIAAEAAQEGAEEAQDAALAAQVAAEAAAEALDTVYTKAEADALLAAKQATLVSGTNIKTVGGTSLLGSGDIALPAPTIASTAEAQAGTNNTNFLTPLRMREGFNASGSAPVYACRAWVNFDGTGTVAIRASGNVSSITDVGAGFYTVSFTTALNNTNYAVIGTSRNNSGDGWSFRLPTGGTKTTSAVQINTGNGAGENDSPDVNVAVFQ